MRRFLLALTLGAALVTGDAVAQLSFLGLKNSLVDFVLDQISVPGEMEITAEGVEEPEDGSTSIVGLSIADGEGVWMRVGSLSVVWNASRILRGELEIERLAAIDVEVLRPPNVAPEIKEDAEIAETDDDPFDWPRSPLTLNLREMRLDNVDIAPGVIAGPGIAFDATGAARDEGDEQSLKLEVLRTDEIAGRIVLEYLRTFDANTLKLDLDAGEEAGGLVAAIAGLPEGSASRVKVQADGPLSDWRMALDAVAEDVLSASGSVILSTADRLSVAAALSIVPGPQAEPALNTVLAPEARLDLQIAESEEGVIQIEQGDLSSPQLTLAASGSYAKPTGAVDLTVDLDGRSGLAALAEGVAFEGFGFEGQVSGTTSDLTANGELRLSGLTTEPADVGGAQLATEVTVQGERVGFDVSGGVTGLRLDRIGPDLLGDTELTAAGVFDAGVLTLEALALSSPLLGISASGRADTNVETAELEYSLQTPDLAAVAGAYDVDASGTVSVSGQVEGPFSGPLLTGGAQLGDLSFQGERYGEVSLDHAVTLSAEPSGRVEVAASGSRYGPAEIATDFALADERLRLSQMAARALGARVEGAVTVALETTLIDGAVEIHVPDLRTLEPVAGQPLAGRVAGEVTLIPSDGTQTVGLDLSLGGFEGFEAEASRLTVEGRVSDALGDPGAEAVIELVGASHPQGAVGEGRVEIDMTGLTTAPGGTVRFELADLAAAGAVAVDRLTGEAELADLIAAPGGTLSFTAGGVSAAGAAEIGTISGRAEVSDALNAPAGSARIEVGSIDASGTQVPSALLEANIVQNAGKADLDAVLTAPSVVSGEARVERVRVLAKIADALGTPRLDIRADAGAVTAEPAQISAPLVTVSGPLSALDIAATAEGSVDLGKRERTPLDARVRARADVSGPELTARVAEARVGLGEVAAALRQPLSIRLAGGTTTLGGIDLALPGGALTGDVTLHPGGAAGDVALRMDDLPALRALSEDIPVTAGTAALTARFDTRAGSARADVDLDANGIVLDKAIADVGALGLTASADWDGRRAESRVSLSGDFGDPLRVEAALPLRPTGALLPAVPEGGEVDAAVIWAGDLGDLWTLVPVPDHILDGRLDLDLRLSGPLAAPRIGGSVSLADGQYQNLETGTILTGLSLTSTLDPAGDIVLDLKGRDGAQGTVEAVVTLDTETVDATVTARKAVLVRRDDVSAQITADIAAKGPLTGPAVSGDVVIDRAEVRLVNATPPSVADLGDVRFKGDPEPEEDEGAGGAISLDISVEAPRDVYVRGRGLDSEWRIDLDITGSAADPRIVGRVERLRGRLDILGRDFALETGEVIFSGGTPIDPRINVALAHENKEGLIGRVLVRGYGSDPEISFASEPQLPEEEVLPRTLFGRSSQSLSPIEALQLANAIATILDGSGGALDTLRGAAGVDVLRLDESDDGEGVAVTVGKNVADGVFVGVKQPVGSGSASVEVEVEVFGDFTVDAETGQDGSSIGLNWRKNF